MKKLYLFWTSILICFNSYSQNPEDFIITYEVDNDNGLYVTYPFYGGQFTIDLGDGNFLTEDDINSGIHHVYDAPGVYTIVVSGDFNRVVYDNQGYNMHLKVKSIEQWGTAQWISMERAFKGLRNLVVNATDTPDLSLVTNMDEMFSGASSFNSPINDWDVSNVTSMYALFEEATLFNQSLNEWDVSNVTNMSGMFSRASSFNQNINDWDVSNVTNMVGMFGCFTEDNSSFNQPLNNWDVSNVTDMYWMFRNAVSFNQPLDNWDVSNVEEFGNMFVNATSFNQDINAWDVTGALSMNSMFKDATAFNQPLNDWDMSSVHTISEMFSGASSFNQPLDNWDISNVELINGLFHHATSFNQDISSWNFESVIDLNSPSYGKTFLSYTALDTANYDALILAFAQSGLQNKTIIAEDVFYCDAAVRSYLIEEAGWNFVDDELSSDCENYSISGAVFFDADNNGCDVSDMVTNGIVVSAINSDFDYGTMALQGSYDLSLIDGTYDLNLINTPFYFDVSPVTTSVTLNNTNSTHIVDFCLTANQTVEDLNIRILPISDARPGFEANYKLIIENIGTETIHNIIAHVTFDASKQSFISATLAEIVTSTNSLSFAISDLNPFQTQEIDIVMQTFTPPTVNGDDVLSFTASVIPNTNDYTPNDNTYQLEQTVVNAYDPNDKRILQGAFITEDDTANYLDYIIRFQNTGTANATFVRIEDDLDTDLDWSTFKVTSASHDYSVNITNGNMIEFVFDAINLPYESVDEVGSTGFIAYKIKPKATVQLGDVMSGNARIYFDYNLPIITNTVSTEVVNNLSVNTYSLESLVTIYPNPTKGGLHLKVNNGVHIKSAKLYNVHGKLLIDVKGDIAYLATEKLSFGVYLLSMETNRGLIRKKVIVN